MRSVILFAMIILFVNRLTEAQTGKGNLRYEVKEVSVDGSFTDAPKMTGTRVEFNTDEELTIRIEGKNDRTAYLTKVYGGPENEKLTSNKNEQCAVYSDQENGVTCRKECDGSGSSCDDYCFMSGENQTCFIMGGKALCMDNDTPDLPDSLNPVSRDSLFSNKTRSRRAVAPDIDAVGIVRVIFHFDDAFMNTFKTMAGGDATTAVAIATKYTKLLANEVTIMYQSLLAYEKTFTFNHITRKLDFAIYVAHIEFPKITESNGFVNAVWSTKAHDASTNTLYKGLAHFNEFLETYSAPQPWDLHTAISGYDFKEGALGFPLTFWLGFAYTSSLCIRERSCSINTLSGLTTSTVAHEIGHNFGIDHDEGNVDNCPSDKHVMAGQTQHPSASNRNHYFKFSSCSASAIVKGMDGSISYKGCLFATGITDVKYLDEFCQGFNGVGLTLEETCKATYGPDSSVCSKGNDNYVSSCSPGQDHRFACYNDEPCDEFNVIPFGTKCTADGDKICYKGECVSGSEICQ